MIHISILKQTLSLPEENLCFSVSTSVRGEGQRENSWQTPLGRHQVAQVIGLDAPIYTRFRSRQPIGIASPESWKALDDEDMILSRIIRLTGLEDGFNRGDGVDSFNRYIYIHGTHQEQLIGKKASKGCIRMRNADIITLCNYPLEGLAVNITEN